MLLPIYAVQFPSTAIGKLQNAGFMYFEDIVGNEASVTEANTLLRDWGINVHSSEDVISVTSSTTAFDLWQSESSCGSIVTFCEAVDEILKGGIRLRTITELCGAPGTGKTQFCLQLCVSVQIPEHFGGVGGEALFIDVDGGFSLPRLREIAESYCDYYQMLLSRSNLEEPSSNFNVERVLNGVHYLEINSYSELLATISTLETFMSNNQKVRVIVVDSLPFTFRYGATSFQSRTRFIFSLIQDLLFLSTKFNIAVIVTNHLTTFLEFSNEGGTVSKSSLVPSLGDSFAHLVGNHLMLGCGPSSAKNVSYKETPHLLMITKSSMLPQALALYQVEDGGIRDVT